MNGTVRKRQICDLPPPDRGEVAVRDREAMNVNPFPGLLDGNDADTADPNLLEKARLVNKIRRSTDQEAIKVYIEQYNALDGVDK